MTIPAEPTGKEIPRSCNDSHLQLAKSKGKGRSYKVTAEPVVRVEQNVFVVIKRDHQEYRNDKLKFII